MSTDLSAVRAPLEHANGLPNAHYTDPATYEEEKHALLFNTWAGLAVAAQVPNPGDAVPLDFIGVPLLLLRDREGRVRVFENICRHRGMILVDAPRKIEGALRCPYHSWCYGLDGKLVSTPHVGGPGQNVHPSIKRDELGLNEVASHIWRDVVFINLSGTAPAFEELHADLIARWADFDKPLFHGGDDSQFDLEARTNWKLAVENYCEAYHLPWIHPGLNSYSRLEDHYNINEPGRYSGQGTLVYRQLTAQNGDTFPDFPDLPEKWNDGAEYIALYPNVLLAAQRDHAYAVVLEPKGIDHTIEHIHLYYAQPDTDATMRKRNCDLWRGVLEEDIFVVEGMQKGRAAPGFDGGRFSPAMDGPTHCFHDWAAAHVQAHRQKLAAE